MRCKILLLLIAAVTLGSTPAAAEDPGKARVTIHLESSQSIPDDVRDALFDKLKVAIRCDGTKIKSDTFEVGTPKQKPEIRGLSASELPPGSCTVLAGIDDNKARTALKIRSGKTATGKVVIKLGWARVAVDQTLEGDQVYLVWTTSKGKAKALALSTAPLVVTLRDYSYVLEHDGEKLEPVALRGMKGETTIQPYGSIAFSSGVLLEGAQVTADGAVVEVTDNTLLLPVGSHTVEVAAVAHRPVSKDVTLKAGRPYRWSTRLTRAKPGKITFEVEGPQEWTLAVDTVDTDASEPVVLPTGPHVISVSADGYDTLTQTLTVTERETRTVAYTLTPSAIELTVSGLPKGARVRVTPSGGSAQDVATRGESATVDLAPGEVTVHVEADDFVPFDERLTLHIGDGTRRVAVDMPSTVVKVTWTGLPPGAALFLEEPGTEPREIPVSPDGVAKARVVAGDVAWRAEKSGYITVADELELEPGDPEQEIAVELPVDRALRSRIRTIVMASAAGGTGVTGIILMGASGGSYAQATAHHDLYLSSTDPDEIVQAKADREAALVRGEGQQVAGVVLTGVGVGVAAATVVLLLLDKKQSPKQIGAIVVPTDGGVAFGLSGRW